ncbi:uncharacterized protein LOC134245264 [Saccostrea cucullata]|uniref:uncharacterized protein LOC134245264 n=1 Tax=Saccostrea cuccullata TaxID=36930 RepID=UPI002ED171CC
MMEFNRTIDEETEDMECEECDIEEQEEVDDILREIFGDDTEDEEVEEDVSEEDGLWNKSEQATNFEDEYRLLRERRFIVGENAILDLLKRSVCEECGDPIIPSSIEEGEKIAAGIKFKFVCINGHLGKWLSSPFYGGRSFISMLLQLMVILSGSSWEQFAMGARFINLAIGTARHFYQMQLQYRVSIEKFFKKHLTEVRASLGGIPISVAVDVRYDTPGFCASRSTAVFMDSNTKAIVHMEVGDCREVGRHSPRMEKLLVEKGLTHLVLTSQLVVWEVISDASRTIIALMKTDPFKHLRHSLDVWHKSKKLAAMLAELAKKSAYKDLRPWIRPIVNHFWWCCSSCKGSVDRLIKRWMTILHHVVNNHAWPGGRCLHQEEENIDMKWLKRDSLSYKELQKMVTNRQWCGSLSYYVSCQQTWAIENFFSHTLLHYCPKQKSYSYDSCNIKNMLAVMDHNYHRHRDAATSQDGRTFTQAQISRRTKQWVSYERRNPKQYAYIPELMATCMLETYGKSVYTYSRSEQAISLDGLSNKPNPEYKIQLAEMKSRKKTGMAASSRR